MVGTGVFGRRALLHGAAAGLAWTATPRLALAALPRAPRMRVILDNDFGGDPDGLFQLAQFSLSPSVEVPLVVGSHYRDFGAADLVPDKAAASVTAAARLLEILGRNDNPPLVGGSHAPLTAPDQPGASAATAAIVTEATRVDSALPLYHASAGSLTEIARAWLAQPTIGRRLTLLWIGGAEHPGLADPPPGPAEPEYNFSLDPVAAQVVFNDSDLQIWQVPRNVFRQMLIGLAELEELAASGPLGQFLWQQVVAAHQRLAANLPPFIFSEGESLMLGDTALVALTALQSAFQPDSSSSGFVTRPTPTLLSDGSYRPNPQGRPMRIYTRIDTRLTFGTMLAAIRAHDRRLAAQS